MIIILIAFIITTILTFEPRIKKIRGIWILEYNSNEKHKCRKKIKLCI